MDDISALMDGELDSHQAQRGMARLKDDSELRERWDLFHLIGDAMRHEQLLSRGFNDGLAKRLQEEPTVLAPRRSTTKARRVTTYALSAAASLSAAALVAWVAVTPNGPASLQAVAPASNAGPVQATAALASIPSDGRMNEYLLAHQGFSPSTALQGLAPYIRSVSATRPEGR
ncbi:MAG TPA: sigma-E factor negative regulatory protein [Burkholderiales bacterium]|nr:sigma-E factor negative regulatory protein [Burkholderiales bacterium]